MNILDIVVVLLLITAIMRGAERGVVRQVCSTTGLIVGFLLGAFLQNRLIHLADTPTDKAIFSIAIIMVLVIVCVTVGEIVGSHLKLQLDNLRHHIVDKADKGAGAVMGGLTLLTIVWLTAAIFSSVPLPGLQRQISHSALIAQLNKSLPTAPTIVANIGHIIDPNGFPQVFTGFEPAINIAKPLPSIGQLDSAVQSARAATVKIQGEGCGGISNGSGFIADPNLVLTNAHVVAGVKNPVIIDAAGRHKATVLWFDPNLDLAVLRATSLAGQPLPINPAIAAPGTTAAVLGYPGGGDFKAQAASVLESFNAVGRNIYNQGNTERTVYSLQTNVEPGNSGGPLVSNDGEVIGIVFAESAAYDEVGYALTMDDVQAGLNQAKDRNQIVSTGACRS